MSKTVSFSEAPDLVRQMSDRSIERRINTQTPNEKRLAMDSFYMEDTHKINEKQENKKKYKKIPISKRVSDSILQGDKADSKIRNEKIASEHRYDYWWLGGNKKKKKSITRSIIGNKIKYRKMKTRKK